MNTEFDLKTVTKEMDESRQGEAFSFPIEQLKKYEGNARKFFIESYGCQMNFSDSEVVASILCESGFQPTTIFQNADLILVNTCAIRDNAEQRVRNRLKEFNVIKERNPSALVGVLGCMAERLKTKFLEEEKIVDIVVGPDAYRTLPSLVEEAETGQKAINVLLSREETYAEINPIRLNSNGITAFISITRGCDNMCSFCVVPFTRGRERSRDPESIVAEAQQLFDKGYKEVTLLGQNVDSYLWYGGGAKKDFKNQSEEIQQSAIHFHHLLEMVAKIHPNLRVRFSTSNPRDMNDDVVKMIAQYENICNYIHLPVQSGSTRILEKMNRGHNREWYLQRIKRIKEIVPDIGLSTDIITGFCSETDEDHADTMSLIEEVGYDMSYMFYYSERPGTPAAKAFEDDVPLDIKKKRLSEIIALQNKLSHKSNLRDVGKIYKVLVEGTSKKSEQELMGRTSQNKVVVFPKENYKPGEYVNVLVERVTSATLIGKVV
jgi:tRNA-2-methylthio-N6-dimethylallyladenosine synthase